MLLCMCLGYLFAVCCFRQELWISRTTGQVVSKYGVFPFKKTVTHRDRAFELYFGNNSSKTPDGEWWLVSRRWNFEPFPVHRYRKGELLLDAERYIVMADLERGFSLAQRRTIGLEFHKRLAEKGIANACQYSSDIFNGKILYDLSTSGDMMQPPLPSDR